MDIKQFTDRMTEYTEIARTLKDLRERLVQLQLFEEAAKLRDLHGDIESHRRQELQKRYS